MRNFAKIVLQNFATKKSEKTVSIVAVTINCTKKLVGFSALRAQH